MLISPIAELCYSNRIMTKKMSIEDLARITAKGFEGVERRFEGVEKRLDGIDMRLDRIESLLLRDHLNRIERLEDIVLQLKVKAGVR